MAIRPYGRCGPCGARGLQVNDELLVGVVLYNNYILLIAGKCFNEVLHVSCYNNCPIEMSGLRVPRKGMAVQANETTFVVLI